MTDTDRTALLQTRVTELLAEREGLIKARNILLDQCQHCKALSKVRDERDDLKAMLEAVTETLSDYYDITAHLPSIPLYRLSNVEIACRNARALLETTQDGGDGDEHSTPTGD